MINLIKKEILVNIRDMRAMFWMTLFPILMILILGFAFSAQFTSDVSIPKTRLVYNIQEKDVLGEELDKFLNQMSEELNMELIAGEDEEQIMEKIKLGQYDIYVKLIKSGEEADAQYDVQLYYNKIRDMNAKLMESVISSFLQRYKAVQGIVQVNPRALENIDMKNVDSSVEHETIGTGRTPTSTDYYAVTMITMTILYGIMAMALGISSERARGTFDRIKTSSAGFIKVYLSKIISGCIIISIQVGVVFLFAKYAINVYFGEDVLTVFLIMLSLILFAVSFGTAMAFMIKNTIVIATVSNMFIVMMVFLGGGYIPLNIFGKNNILMYIGKISPIKWVNDAIFQVVYTGNKSLVPYAIGVCVTISLVFMIISGVIGITSWPRKRGA